MQLELIKFPDGSFGIRKGVFVKQYYAFTGGIWCTRMASGEVRTACKADEGTARRVFEALNPELELIIDTRTC